MHSHERSKYSDKKLTNWPIYHFPRLTKQTIFIIKSITPVIYVTWMMIFQVNEIVNCDVYVKILFYDYDYDTVKENAESVRSKLS